MEMSLDEELGMPYVVTPSVRRYPVDRLRHDGFSTHHYAYVVKVIEELELACFEDVLGKKIWVVAMDANHT